MNFNLKNHSSALFTVPADQLDYIFENALQWAFSFSHFAYYDSNTVNNVTYVPTHFDRLLAVDCHTKFSYNSLSNNILASLELFINTNINENIFGNISYDLKNEIELLKSEKNDRLQFEEHFLFCPVYVIIQIGNTIQIISKSEINNPLQIFNHISALKINTINPNNKIEEKVDIHKSITKQEYTIAFEKIKKLIEEGVVYELNYCQEFYFNNIDLDVLTTFKKLNTAAKAPMTALLKNNDQFIISASPERYIQKNGSKIFSQPIKGTAKRGKTIEQDIEIQQRLSSSLKERAENIMIVDLTRNDLSRCCKVGSIKVEELCKIYTFNTVHQLISTISGHLLENICFTTILKNTFPMGSMTGAPKISAMQCIEELEFAKRGVFSGCIGYISSDGNFDFNVAIRTLMYNGANKILSFQSGGAITIDSVTEDEYNECLLKSNALLAAITKVH